MAVEKLVISKLLVEGSNRRIYNVDRHAGVVRTMACTQTCMGAGIAQPCGARACKTPAMRRFTLIMPQAASGLAPDGRMIVSRASDEAANYKRFYGEPIPGHVLCDRVASYVHMFNLYWAFR